ncbi:conserved protein of unknown function [Georgfuchsia toluolica]|uniref:Uncharacterized protein n=1 Tax=Georgfuchsia toluolica TaxID=424218 RepID=A0A916J1Q9_9PROT|nr:hypothetical protein [Georgfuchsia toluolica]CAG4883069.1 conserved protein of unknown function [Georgfuchsia toluolica]
MDYAQSRLQARFGERPDESLWQKLEASSDLDHALAVARASGLRRWVAGITAQADCHAIEIALRTGWRECIAEIDSWMPSQWRPALMWVCGLVDLPALYYLARGEAPLPWMHVDPVLQVYAGADAQHRETLLQQDCRAFLDPSQEVSTRSVSPASSRIRHAWLKEWRKRWPRWNDTAALESLTQLFETAMEQPALASRPELLRKMRSLFRRSVLCPAVAFIYLAFIALDLERLRAGLLRHTAAFEGIFP